MAMNFLPGPMSHLPQNAAKALIGPGDLVKDQLNSDLNERRKAMTRALSAGPGAYGSGLLGASKDLLG